MWSFTGLKNLEGEFQRRKIKLIEDGFKRAFTSLVFNIQNTSIFVKIVNDKETYVVLYLKPGTVLIHSHIIGHRNIMIT